MEKKKKSTKPEKSENTNIIREARSGRKFWREHEVDINLDEEWLEKLNSLKCFSLCSICEGHYHSEKPGYLINFPHVRVKFNPRKGFNISELFKRKGQKLKRILKECFNEKYIIGEFYYGFEVSISSYSDDFFLSCRSQFPRTSEKPDKKLNEFYEKSVSGIIKLDKLFEVMIQVK